MNDSKQIGADELRAFIAHLFAAAGLSSAAAERVAAALVEADLSGKSSHGILQADAYLARLMAGSMTTTEQASTVSDSHATVVMDAGNMMGHLAAEHGMTVAIDRAKEYGISAVAMRNGYHFGVAGRYVRMAADHGCIGMAMCNTRPIAAAPGGAQRLLGTNPLAIAIPTAQEPPIVFDMATTAGSVGKIRYAQASGDTIPEGWAVDADGQPTTDPAEALKGVLLPMGGAKGFGLAFSIDLMCGLLASGGWGPTLGELRGDLSKHYNASFLFMAIDIEHFRALDGFLNEAQSGAERVRQSKRAPGIDRIYTPGERNHENLHSSDGVVTIPPSLLEKLGGLAERLNVSLPNSLS